MKKKWKGGLDNFQQMATTTMTGRQVKLVAHLMTSSMQVFAFLRGRFWKHGYPSQYGSLVLFGPLLNGAMPRCNNIVNNYLLGSYNFPFGMLIDQE